jgi:hypothetical protein
VERVERAGNQSETGREAGEDALRWAMQNKEIVFYNSDPFYFL